MRFIDLTNQRFGRLVVIKMEGRNDRGMSLWLCRCDCGKQKIIHYGSLKAGHVKSCGCYRKEFISKSKYKHGMVNTRPYSSWKHMLERVSNPNCTKYPSHGGRGITVCDRWKKFENFYEDMGDPPVGMTLDRINNDGNYELSNCRWADATTQARNKRNNITFNGECASEASRRLGGNIMLVSIRIRIMGWTKEKAFTTPPIKKI